MNSNYIKQAQLNQMRFNIKSNIEDYKKNECWFPDYFGYENWHLESKIEMPDGLELICREKTGKDDLENTKILYSGLKNISTSQAIDERFWAYLSHVTFWDYMSKRWSVKEFAAKEGKTEKEITNYIKDRYFFMSNKHRALVRNGIARLWWYGHVSYDESRKDPFELTKVLLDKLDVAQSLLERNFSSNITITRTVLSVLAYLDKKGKPFDNREKFRSLMKHINSIGGVTILDALQGDDVEKVVITKISKLGFAV